MLVRPVTAIIFLGAAAIGIGVFVGLPWRWFSYHPLLMLVSHLALAPVAISFKRERKGRTNTLLHAGVMLLATSSALVGWYVIYQQKIMLGKPHNTSYHSWAGLLTLFAFCGFSVGGIAGLHPDFGLLRSSTTFRTAHKLGGRAAAVASFFALTSGVMKSTGYGTAAVVSTTCLAVAWVLLRGEGPSGPGSAARRV